MLKSSRFVGGDLFISMFAQEAAVVTLESNQALLLPSNPQLLKWKSLWAVTNTCSRSRAELETKVRKYFTNTEKASGRAFSLLKESNTLIHS